MQRGNGHVQRRHFITSSAGSYASILLCGMEKAKDFRQTVNSHKGKPGNGAGTVIPYQNTENDGNSLRACIFGAII
jgi:hypothetical protein